ncbi:MAG: DNA polymerase I, partial [Treponema sp.]|nr:DNA polymerase I [Treponema sp.]
MPKEPLYLIDAYGLIYRSYFAFLSRPLFNPEGKNVSALFGFARTLVTLLDAGAPAPAGTGETTLKKPLRLAAIFDPKGPTFRHKMYPEYKATRQKTPDDLHAQVPLVEEFLSALGVPFLMAEGYEADDIIATLTEKCKAEKRDCFILSSDKDLLQLVGDGTWELRPVKAYYDQVGLPYELVGPKEVKAEWGVNPDRILDLLSLTGDSSDNVPGVKGVGDKTAVKLMARYGSLDEIYKNIAGIEGAIGKKIAEGKESAYFSKSLIKLEASVPLAIKDIEELSIEKLNRAAGAKVLMREGIRQSAKQLDPSIGRGEGETQNDNRAQGVKQAAAAGKTERKETVDARVSAPPKKELSGEGKYKTILDIKELEAFLSIAEKEKLLALDFETDSLDAWNAKPIGISFSIKPKEAFYIPLAAHRGKTAGDEQDAPFIDPEKVKTLLSLFFANPGMTIIAHNAKYDYKVSRGWGIPRWKCRIWDSIIAAWL